jgi:hypothetical protein
MRKPWAGGVRTHGVTATIYADLRNELILRQRLPGESIAESELALQHMFSRTPVRETVLRLAGEGLVEVFPQSTHSSHGPTSKGCGAPAKKLMERRRMQKRKVVAASSRLHLWPDRVAP